MKKLAVLLSIISLMVFPASVTAKKPITLPLSVTVQPSIGVAGNSISITFTGQLVTDILRVQLPCGTRTRFTPPPSYTDTFVLHSEAYCVGAAYASIIRPDGSMFGQTLVQTDFQVVAP